MINIPKSLKLPAHLFSTLQIFGIIKIFGVMAKYTNNLKSFFFNKNDFDFASVQELHSIYIQSLKLLIFQKKKIKIKTTLCW
jgi:hypothetical protein